MHSIVVRHHFDAAHRLSNYDGKCCQLHGHRWEVEVGLWGDNLHNGMLVDFSMVKRAIDTFDHSTILWVDDPLLKVLEKYSKRLGTLPFPKQPTAENIAEHLHNTLTNTLAALGLDVYVDTVTVWESPNAKAVYVKGE